MCISSSNRMHLFTAVLLSLIFLVINVNSADVKPKFPSYIKVCKRNSEVMKCIAENIERCKPYLAKGIPRLQIPPMAPFVVPSLHIVGNNLEIKLKNLRVSNLDKMEVVGGDVNLENFRLQLQLSVPYVYSQFDYDASGKVLFINFKGNGAGDVNATDITIHIDANGHKTTKNGKDYIDIGDINVDYKSKNAKMNLGNLFGDTREDLNVQTNRLINDNFRQFEDEISPDIAKSISALIHAIADNLFKKFSLDELFPME